MYKVHGATEQTSQRMVEVANDRETGREILRCFKWCFKCLDHDNDDNHNTISINMVFIVLSSSLSQLNLCQALRIRYIQTRKHFEVCSSFSSLRQWIPSWLP